MTFGFSGVQTLGTEQALATECTYDKVRNQFYMKLIQLLNDSNRAQITEFASYTQGIKLRTFAKDGSRVNFAAFCFSGSVLLPLPSSAPALPSVASSSASLRHLQQLHASKWLRAVPASPSAASCFKTTPGSSCVTFGSTVLQNRLRAVPAVLTAVAPQNVSSSSAAVSMLFSMRHLS